MAALLAILTLSTAAACNTKPHPAASPNATPSSVDVQIGHIYELTPLEQALARSQSAKSVDPKAAATTKALLADQFVPIGKMRVDSPQGEWHIVFGYCPWGEASLTLEREQFCNQQVQNPSFEFPRVERVMNLAPDTSRPEFASYRKQPTLYPYPFSMQMSGENKPGAKIVTVNCLSSTKPYGPPNRDKPGMAGEMVEFAQANRYLPGDHYAGKSPPKFGCTVSKPA